MEPTGDSKGGSSYDKSTAVDLQKLFKSIDALNNKLDDLNNKVDALNHKIDSSTNESDAFKHETRSRFNELKSATDEQTKLIRRISDEIQEKLSRGDQSQSHDPIQCQDSKHMTKEMRGETEQKTQQHADASSRSTVDRTSPLGGNSPNHSMTEWSMLGACGGGYEQSPGAMANERINKDCSVGSSQSTSTLTPSKVAMNYDFSEFKVSIASTTSFKSTDTDTEEKTVDDTPAFSLHTTSFKQGEGSSYYTEEPKPRDNAENQIPKVEDAHLQVPPLGANAGEESTYRERETHVDQDETTPSTSLDPTAIKKGYASTYDNESQIIETTKEPEPSQNPHQNANKQEDSQADGNDAIQAPETEGPNTDVAVVGVRTDGESTYYNEGHEVPQSDRQDGSRAQATKIRPVSIKSGDNSTMDIDDSMASQGPSANSSNIDVQTQGIMRGQGEDSAYHTDGSQRSGSDLNQVQCPESPTSPVTSLGPNVGNAVSFYENRESADHVTNEPISDESSRDPIGADGDSGSANREDRQLDVPDQPSCPVCHLEFPIGTPEEVLHAHVNRHFDGSMVESAQSLPHDTASSRQAPDTMRPEPYFSRPMPPFSRQAHITSRPKPEDSPKSQNVSRSITDNTPKTPNISRPAPDTSRPQFDTTHPPPNASRPTPITMRPKPLLCILCPKSFPANQQREYEAHVQTHVV